MTLVAVLGGVGALPGTGATVAAADRRAALSVLDQVHPGPEETGPAQGPSRFVRESAAREIRAAAALAVPAHSGKGRRVVFDTAAQRVWLVGVRGGVRRTYPVSGSVTDNLPAGSYEVYSRSEQAWGIDDSGTMRFMVRFAHGEHAAIGFHDIPVKDGRLVQTRDELGSPRSHGCIRQWRPDAKALWRFAPVGTPVVVV